MMLCFTFQYKNSKLDARRVIKSAICKRWYVALRIERLNILTANAIFFVVVDFIVTTESMH